MWSKDGRFKKGVRSSPKTEFKKGVRSNIRHEFKKGQIPHNKGKKATPEQIRKNSESHKGQVSWLKGKKGYTNRGTFKKGHKHSEAVLEKMRKTKKANPLVGAKNPFYRKKHSEGSRKRMSISQKKTYDGINGKERKKRISTTLKKRYADGRVVWNKGKNTGLIPWNKGKNTGLIPWNKGKTGIYSEEHLKKMSESRKGQTSPMKGRKHSEVSNQKNRLAHLGKKYPPGRFSAMKGKKHTEEAKRKTRESLINLGKVGKLWMQQPGAYSESTLELLRKARLHQVIPSKDTKIEKTLQNKLQKNGIEFEKHIPILGQPDIFVEPNICIFADGDWWHGWFYLQGVDFSKQKKFNNNYFENRIRRDVRVTEQLREEGYTVLRFWEHEIEKDPEECLQKIIKIIKESRR